MLIRSFRELDVYQRSKAVAIESFRLSAAFPKHETYSLTDPVRRSSRSVSANIAEAWGKRRYPAAFVSKLSDVESEIYETQAWLDYVQECEYASKEIADKLIEDYEKLLRSTWA